MSYRDRMTDADVAAVEEMLRDVPAHEMTPEKYDRACLTVLAKQAMGARSREYKLQAERDNKVSAAKQAVEAEYRAPLAAAAVRRALCEGAAARLKFLQAQEDAGSLVGRDVWTVHEKWVGSSYYSRVEHEVRKCVYEIWGPDSVRHPRRSWSNPENGAHVLRPYLKSGKLAVEVLSAYHDKPWGVEVNASAPTYFLTEAEARAHLDYLREAEKREKERRVRDTINRGGAR